MSGCDIPGLMTLDEALQSISQALDNVCEEITLPLADALGYSLSESIRSSVNVPAFNNSAMDGYAVICEDLEGATTEQPVTLTMVGKSFAGSPYTGEVTPGQCIRIMTGALIPDSLNAVVMQERCIADGQQITFNALPKLSDNVRFAGEDLAVGDLVLTKGHKLTVRDIPLLASLGIAKVKVFRRLKVAIFSSGDELKGLDESLQEGEIYDSNRYSINALLSKLNVEVIDLGIVKDDYQAISAVIKEADQAADVVISSAGVSVGEADFIKDALAELGQINFWKLAIKPGKPFAFGKLPNSVFLGLPGNPVSAMVTLYQLAVPALAKLSGETISAPVRLPATSGSHLRKRPGRIDFQRGTYQVDSSGQLIVTSTGGQGSGIFSSMSQSNCFIVLEQERGNVSQGETVIIEPYSSLLN